VRVAVELGAAAVLVALAVLAGAATEAAAGWATAGVGVPPIPRAPVWAPTATNPESRVIVAAAAVAIAVRRFMGSSLGRRRRWGAGPLAFA